MANNFDINNVADDVSDGMDAHDIAALRLAIQAVHDKDGPDCIEQVETKLADDGFFEGGKCAAFHRQVEALDLKPWQAPPCVVSATDPHERDKDAQRLLRRMLKAGVSRYHPDPMAALEEAKRKGAA